MRFDPFVRDPHQIFALGKNDSFSETTSFGTDDPSAIVGVNDFDLIQTPSGVNFNLVNTGMIGGVRRDWRFILGGIIIIVLKLNRVRLILFIENSETFGFSVVIKFL